jgi:hypothetical protein
METYPFALSIAFALMSGSVFAATALNAPITHNEVSTPPPAKTRYSRPAASFLTD